MLHARFTLSMLVLTAVLAAFVLGKATSLGLFW